MEQNKIVVFESKRIRRIWHNEEWYFSVVDVCGALIDSPDDLTARKYWNKLAQRLRNEGSEVVTNCHRLKLEAPDGKGRDSNRYSSADYADYADFLFIAINSFLAFLACPEPVEGRLGG